MGAEGFSCTGARLGRILLPAKTLLIPLTDSRLSLAVHAAMPTTCLTGAAWSMAGISIDGGGMKVHISLARCVNDGIPSMAALAGENLRPGPSASALRPASSTLPRAHAATLQSSVAGFAPRCTHAHTTLH